MGLIKQIDNVSQMAAVQESEKHYKRIEIWKALMSGYLAKLNDQPFHSVKWKDTTGKPRERNRASMRMPKVISEAMANIVFNEKCSINISTAGINTESDPNQDILKKIFDDNLFYKVFQNKLEGMFSLGGLVLKPYYNGGKILIEYVQADSFLPTQSTGDKVDAGVFVNTTRKSDRFYTLLEWHEWVGNTYRIRNELYESSMENDLGEKIDLAKLYPDLEPEINIDGLTRPLFVYIKPNIANNFDMDSPLGISIFANALDTLKSIDIAFDSFQREFILGKKRIMVPQTAIRSVVDTETGEMRQYFDANDEVFVTYAESQDNSEIKDIMVELRVDEHIAAINALLNILAMQTGFSAGTFSFDGRSVKTATEIVSENSKTFRTKNAHENVIEEGIKELVQSILELLKLYGEISDVPNVDVSVDFDDSIAEDRQANANYWLSIYNGQLIPRWMAIKHTLKVTDEQAKQIAQEVASESQTVTPDISDLYGGNGG